MLREVALQITDSSTNNGNLILRYVQDNIFLRKILKFFFSKIRKKYFSSLRKYQKKSFFFRHIAWIREYYHSKELVLLIQKQLKYCLVPTKKIKNFFFTFSWKFEIGENIEYFFATSRCFSKILSLERALFAYSDSVKILFGPKKKKFFWPFFRFFLRFFNFYGALYFFFQIFLGTKQSFDCFWISKTSSF